MLAKVQQIDGAWQRHQSSRAFKKAEEMCGIAAVCVVGTQLRQPRCFGDNEGAHPTRIVVTEGNPDHAAASYNRGHHSPGQTYETLAVVYVADRLLGNKIKEWLDETIDKSGQAELMMNNFRDVEPWKYEILFSEASAALGIEVFDAIERARRIWNLARRGSV